MFKFTLLLFSAFVLCYSYPHTSTQHNICNDFSEYECNNNVLCMWEESVDQCRRAYYTDLGHSREDIPQYIIFKEDYECNYNIYLKDFVASQSFENSHGFRSFCRGMNINKIRVYNDHKKDDALVGANKNALIYPQAADGCVLLYSEINFSGESWEICRPTKLNGQIIKSIMIGNRAQLSLYDDKTKPMHGFEQLTYTANGYPDIHGHHFEYALIEKYDNEKK